MTRSDERDLDRASDPREFGAAVTPQGEALIFELRRLQKALAQERQDHAPVRRDDADAPPSRRATRKRRGRRDRGQSALDSAVALCLGMLGLNRPPRADRPPADRARPRAGREDIPTVPRRGRRAQPTRWRALPERAGGGDPTPALCRTVAPDPQPMNVARLDATLRMDLPRRVGLPAGDPVRPAASGVIAAGLTGLWFGCEFLIGRVAGPGLKELSGEELAGRVKRAYDGELRRGLRVLIASVGILGGWATLMPLAGAVVVPGSLVVESSVKKIQHPTGGVVARIPVENGMHVKAGDLLLSLDATQVRANHQVVLKQLDQLRVRIARLLAERDGLDRPKAPPELASRLSDGDIAPLWSSEVALFNSRAAARRSAKELLHSHVAQLGEEIAGLQAQVKSKAEQRDLVAGELEGVEALFQKGLVPLTRKTSLQREAARLNGELGQTASAIAEAKSKISEAELQIVRVDQDFRTEVMKDLRESQDKEAELVEKDVATQDLLNRVDVRAPTSGIVHELSVHTVGGVISAGEVVMEIVPESSDLQIEARLPPQDIDQVRQGQKAYIRFSAFNQRTTPQLEGVVSYVSADLIHDRLTNAAYYMVRLTLPAGERHRLGPLQLVSGMPAEVFLETGTRTLMSYLLKPIRDQLQRTFSER